MKNILKKKPGICFVDIGGNIHKLHCDDQSHPKREQIKAKITELFSQIEKIGYKPLVSPSLTRHLMYNETEKEALCAHSEKMAIALVLLETPNDNSPIFVSKNLRVCPDCHLATCYISAVIKRDIIVRDANRFHHYSNGKCSCDNYW